MFDSVFTLTKGSAGWLLGGVVASLVLDRIVVALTGLAASMFLVIAAGLAGFLCVAAVYTIARSLLHHSHPGGT